MDHTRPYKKQPAPNGTGLLFEAPNVVINLGFKGAALPPFDRAGFCL